ncbi:uncharacterized protein LOC100182474 [Ciona intestinalis]
MWGQCKWQYFTATIISFNPNSLKYTIEWDDQDPTGRVIDYFNLALDKVPSNDQVGVGSKVLFHQGTYKQSEVHGVTRSGGLRWHQGEIERIYKDQDGNTLYDGHHTRGEKDGKWVTFKDYSFQFIGYSLEDFRMPPNVFDILSSIDSGPTTQTKPAKKQVKKKVANKIEDSIDVFVSYAKINCPSAIQNHELDQPPSYREAVLDNMVDPRNIVEQLKKMGVSVFTMEEETDTSLLEIVSALKRVKVFIACLSDEYASNDRCRMEFQYAKKTMKLPVIPLVVGSGSFEWQMTVVGLLIAGELYIHFQNKEVESYKMTELARSIKSKIPGIKIKDVSYPATGAGVMDLHSEQGVGVTGKPVISGTADIFFSYCWNNSHDAHQKKQVSSYQGGEWSDPRLIVKKISEELGIASWIDVERLESANEGMGMFDQIATALKECKLAVVCVSTEYANSDNCRMEIQFAVKSLKKPVVAVIVGTGDDWKESVVGNIVDEGIPKVDLQSVTSAGELEVKISEISKAIQDRIPLSTNPSMTSQNQVLATEGSPERNRAPKRGDHVICLHMNWAYYKATVESFDHNTMTYTVNWDDNDPSGRVQSYKDVALDIEPVDDIAVGSIVLFQQGSYAATEGNNEGGVRYHQGIITGVHIDEEGVKRFSGKHTKGESGGKWVTYGGYNPTFEGVNATELRLSPNAMDVVMSGL